MTAQVRLVMATSIAALALLVSIHTSAALAYTHSWSCGAASYVQCYDNAGQQYNPWAYVRASMVPNSSTICAKAITAAGNLRNPQACLSNTNLVAACLNPAFYPESWAYVYWGGPGTIRTINGYANSTNC